MTNPIIVNQSNTLYQIDSFKGCTGNDVSLQHNNQLAANCPPPPPNRLLPAEPVLQLFL